MRQNTFVENTVEWHTRKEMKFLFDCQVEEMGDEVKDLAELIKAEVKQINERLDAQEILFSKVRKEYRDEFYNLKTK